MKQKILFVGNFFSKLSINPTYEELLAQRIERSGTEVFRVSCQTNKMLRLIDILFGVLWHRLKYDCVHVSVFSGGAFIWAEITTKLVKLLKKRVAVVLHGGNLPEFSAKHPKRVARLLELADVIIAPSRYLQEALNPFTKKNIYIIPNALTVEDYSYRSRSIVKQKLIWIRAFHNIYNPMLIPVLMNLLREKIENIEMLMIGPDKKDGSLEKTRQLILKFDLQNQIRIIQGIRKNEVPIYLNQADIFLNTTNIDNTPVSIMEAMACGLCIVSTNVGGIPYLLENQEEALLVPPDNPEMMLAAVIRLLKESELAEKLSQNARKKAESFDWSQVLPQWEKHFQSLGR